MVIKGHQIYTRRLIRFVVIVSCIICMGVLYYLNHLINEDVTWDINQVKVKALDGEIRVEWENTGVKKAGVKNFLVCITGGEDEIAAECKPEDKSYSFTDGVHGTLYTVSVTAEFQSGEKTSSEKQLLYLDYAMLPDLPLLIMDTVNEEEPTYTEAIKSDADLLGETITDNEYVNGVLRTSGLGYDREEFQMKIRIRGNTSALGSEKKPYKLTLENGADFLGKGAQSAHKEWDLLSCGTSINTYLGCYTADLCGMEWQPDMIFVNLILNGDWKGCYCLIEPVSKETAGSYVSSSGYIFENDAYYWNADGIYFQTLYPTYDSGYTVKYPRIDKADDVRLARMQAYMQQFEDAILSGDDNYHNYIEESSFVAWTLARDILGLRDGVGSNMYFYKYDYQPDNPTASKVKMGPLWDFDSAFQTEDQWSVNRGIYVQFLEQQSFYDCYVSQWEQVSEHLADDVEENLQQLSDEQGEALDESWALDEARWNIPVSSLQEQINQALAWYQRRIEWMNQQIWPEGEE